MKSRYSKTYKYGNSGKSLDTATIQNRVKYIYPYVAAARTILELGCGDGELASQIAKKTQGRVYGVDISPSGVKIAIRRGIEASIADLNDTLPYPNNYFDVIYSDQLVEHIYRTDHLFNEIYRVLKPGGVVITITPNLSFWPNRFLFIFGLYPIFLEVGEQSKTYGENFLKTCIQDHGAMGHIRVFNLSALEDMLRAHKFSKLHAYGFPRSWILPWYAKIIYDAVDSLLCHVPSLARDIVVIASK